MSYEIKKVEVNSKNVLITLYKKEELSLEILIKTYLDNTVYVGQVLTDENLKKIKEDDIYNRIYDYALSIMKKGDISSYNLKQKLLKKYRKYKEFIDLIIKKMKDLNYLNDDELITQEIEKSLRSYKGLERIKYELSMKGFSKNKVEESIKDYHYEQEKEYAFNLGKKTFNLNNKLDFRKVRDKVYYKLNYAGYSKELIQEVMYKLNLIKENY